MRKVLKRAALLLVLGVLVTGAVVYRQQRGKPGPVVITVPFGNSIRSGIVSFPVGGRAVFGVTLLRNDGAAPAELLTASLLAPTTQGATITDVRILDYRRVHAYPVTDRWPTEFYTYAQTEPLAGFTLKPHYFVSLVFFIRNDRLGEWHWNEIRLSYRYGGRVYRIASTNSRFEVCPDDQCAWALPEKKTPTPSPQQGTATVTPSPSAGGR